MSSDTLFEATVSGNDLIPYASTVSDGDAVVDTPSKSILPATVENEVINETGWTSETADALLDSVQVLQTDMASIQSELVGVNTKLSVMISVVIILLLWKLCTVIYKLLDMFF